MNEFSQGQFGAKVGGMLLSFSVRDKNTLAVFGSFQEAWLQMSQEVFSD